MHTRDIWWKKYLTLAQLVQFTCMNTDTQALGRSLASETLQLGPELTRGLGAGGKPEVGEAAAAHGVDAESRQVVEVLLHRVLVQLVRAATLMKACPVGTAEMQQLPFS
mgnify:CR=1 FL=1